MHADRKPQCARIEIKFISIFAYLLNRKKKMKNKIPMLRIKNKKFLTANLWCLHNILIFLFCRRTFFFLVEDCGYVWADVNLKVCTQYIARVHTHKQCYKCPLGFVYYEYWIGFVPFRSLKYYYLLALIIYNGIWVGLKTSWIIHFPKIIWRLSRFFFVNTNRPYRNVTIMK